MKRNKLITLSFLMAVVMIMSVFSATLSVCAAEYSAEDMKTTAVSNNYNAEYPIEACHVRSKDLNTFSGDQSFVLDGYLGDHRVGFMKFDFSSVNFNNYNGLQLKLAGFKTSNAGLVGTEIDIKISLIPDELEDAATVSTLTYNDASTAGWLDSGNEIGKISGTMPDTSDPNFYSTDILNAIKTDVANNDNTIVLRIESNIKENGYAATYYAAYPIVGYYKQVVHVVPMTGSAVTTGRTNAQADADAITTIPSVVESGNTIAFPSVGTINSSKITWESDSAYIDAETGAVASVEGFSDKVVTLTASVINNYIVVKKEFQVTVKASMIQQIGDYVTIKAHGTGFENSNKNQTTHLIVNPQYSNNRHQGILRFDLTSIKETINSLDDISLRLTFAFIKQTTTGADLTTGKYELKILPHMNWSVSTMTYDYIYKYGATEENPNGTNMFRNAVFASKSGTVPTEVGKTMVFTGLKAKIAEYIANYPDATTITFLLAGENLDYSTIEDSVRFYVPNGQEDPSTDATAPVLIGETSKRFVAVNDNGAVTFTYNADSAKYPKGINMATTFFVAEYAPDGSLVNVVSGTDSVITKGETKTLTITGYTSGNTIKAMVFNNSSEIMAMQPVTIFGN